MFYFVRSKLRLTAVEDSVLDGNEIIEESEREGEGEGEGEEKTLSEGEEVGSYIPLLLDGDGETGRLPGVEVGVATCEAASPSVLLLGSPVNEVNW